MGQDQIVAVGFLTHRDLEVLGDGFSRAMPVQHDGMFDDLLAQLDDIEATPLGRGVVLHTRR